MRNLTLLNYRQVHAGEKPSCGYATGWMTWELELDYQHGQYFLFSSASPILGLSKPVVDGDTFHSGKAVNA